MRAFIVVLIASFLVYLLLTTGSEHDFFIWGIEEIIIGLIFSVIVGLITRKILIKNNFRMLNPLRWFMFLGYAIGPFFVYMAKANLDVAYRVITGRINPGIVKISPELKSDLGVTMLANSITLTPGTLSVDVDEKNKDLYVHWINVDEKTLKKKPRECEPVCASFPKWIRRIAE